MKQITYYDFCHQDCINELLSRLQDFVNNAKMQYKENLDNTQILNYPSDIVVDKEEIKTLKNLYHSKLSNNIKKQIKKQSKLCPYCGFGEIYEVDHFLPKSKYPELSIVSYNLVPSCGVCNNKKGSFINTTNYHPYNNNIGEYLTVTISKSDNCNSLVFHWEIVDDYKILLQPLFDRLNLSERYITRTISEIDSFKEEWKKSSVQSLKTTLDILSKRSTHWQKILFIALKNNVDLLFEYIKIS